MDAVSGLVDFWKTALWNDKHAIYECGRFNVIATLVCFLLSLAHGNSSWYDPYWSVAPVANALYFAALSSDSWLDLHPRKLALLFLITCYGARLTISWWRRLGNTMFLGNGMTKEKHEDWRYLEIQDKPKMGKTMNSIIWWAFSSPFLIHLYPTICTWLGSAPMFYALSLSSSLQKPFGPVDILACLFLGGGALMEAVADWQMDAHLKETANDKKRSVCRKGLWSVSRHPNYCGEMAVWLGIFLFGWASGENHALPSIIGFLNIVILFATASIPWMERRQLERRGEEYKRYQKEVACVVPYLL
jgi:steroid 5-alpha reductase family enzyme